MDGRRRLTSPLQGSARGVGFVVLLGVLVMLAGLGIAGLLTWVMT